MVLADTEDVWKGIFKQNNLTYQEPTLVLYTDQTPTACGTGQAAAGPFYCPGDRKLYLDLNFLGEMKRMGATGDFALAYVIAHEVGHHVQTLVSTADKVRQMQARSSTDGRRTSSRCAMELQADCFAGVWANHAQSNNEKSSKRATSKKASAPQPPSATTTSNAWPAAASSPKPSPTAPPNNAWTG